MLEMIVLAGVLSFAAGSGLTLALRNKIPADLTPKFLRKDRSANSSESAIEEELTVEDVGDQFIKRINSELYDEITVLKKVQKLHAERRTGLQAKIQDVLNIATKLFILAQEKQGGQSARLAAVLYTSLLQKLNRALGTKYYLNIIKEPRFWENPEERMAAVEKALEATYNQILSNIQQVNASQDIEISADVEALIGAADDSFKSMA